MSTALRDLDYFLEIARRGQLASAAAQLDVTSAALSKAVRRLEAETGIALFERSGNGMQLTAFGQVFRTSAEAIKREHDDLMRHAGAVRAGRAGSLRLGATVATLESLLAPALARLQPRRPALHAELSVGASDEVLERVRHGRLDAAVVPTYGDLPAGLDHEALGRDELIAVARQHHPLFRARRLSLAGVAACSWTLPRDASAARRQLDAAFRAAGHAPPRCAVEVDVNSAWSLPLVAATDLVSLVPSSALALKHAEGVRVLGLDALRLPRTIGWFSRPGSHASPLLREFMLELKSGRAGTATKSRT